MKAIISHDVDHITVSEHYLKDLIVPKFFVRSYIELLTGKIEFSELYNRFLDLFKNKWQHLEELQQFNKEHSVPATYFIAVNNGVGLHYSIKQADFWIKKLLSMNCEVGIHSIEFESLEKIQREFQLFKDLSQLENFGTRMHYIRTNCETYNNMATAGYMYDTTELAFKAPYKVGEMWEFPFQIMDGYIIQKPKQWQSKNLQACCDETKNN